MPALTLPYTSEPNLAASKPLEQRMMDAAGDTSIEIDGDWFKEQKETLLKENEPVWKDKHLLWMMIFMFIAGQQILKRARHGGGWRAVPLPDRTDSPVHALNILGFYVDAAKSKWANSNTDIKWRPTSDADQAEGSAKAATHVNEYQSRRLYTAAYKMLEATLAQCGKYARYYYWSNEAKGYARRPKVERQQVQFGESTYFCPDCGEGGVLNAGGVQPAQAADPFTPTQDQSRIEDLQAAQEGALSGQPASIGGLAPGYPGDGRAPGMPVTPGPADAGMGMGPQPAMPQATGIGQEIPAGIMAGSGVGADVLGTQAVCPECGSPNAEIEAAEPFEVEAIVGHETYETGNIVCESPPAFELRHDIAFDPQDSPYLIRSRRIRHAVLRSKFPYLKFGQSKTKDSGLDAQEELKKSSYASTSRVQTMASHEDSKEEQNDFTQVWLDPCMYSRLKLRDGYRTMAGMEIPAGTALIDLFPDGFYMCFISGIDGVIEMRNEHHRDYWVGTVLRQLPVSSLGSGQEDAIEAQRQYNLTNSMIYTVLRTCANPATLYDATLLPNGTSAYLGNPLKNIPVETQRLEGKSLKDAVHQLTPQPPSQQHFAYKDSLNNNVQLATRVTDFSGALPGVDNDTATGAEIAAANSQSNFTPQLMLKAELERRGAEIVLALFKIYCIDETYISLSGKRGKQDGIWLKAADIEVDLYAEVVPESYLPQTNLERRKRLQGLLTDVGGLPGLQMAMESMPSLVEKLAETYDVDLGAEDFTAAAETARQRIDQMAQAVPMLQIAMQQMPPVQMAPDPMTGEPVMVPVDPMAEAGQFLLGILQPPIELEEIGHLAAIDRYRSFLTEDEGKEAPPEVRAGVKAAIYRHAEGLMAEAQLMGMVQMAGQPAPPMEGEGGPPEGSKNKSPQGSQMKGGNARNEMKAKRKEKQQGAMV